MLQVGFILDLCKSEIDPVVSYEGAAKWELIWKPKRAAPLICNFIITGTHLSFAPGLFMLTENIRHCFAREDTDSYIKMTCVQRRTTNLIGEGKSKFVSATSDERIGWEHAAQVLSTHECFGYGVAMYI